MKKNTIRMISFFLLILMVSGCYMKEAGVIMSGTPLQSTLLSESSRVLLCETTPGFATYEIKKLGQKVNPSSAIIVEPPLGKYSGALLPNIAKAMAGEMNVDIILIAVKIPYNKEYIHDGKNKKNLKLILIQFECDVYQYDKSGELIGRNIWPGLQWPDKIKHEWSNLGNVLYYDAIVEYQKWLNTNLPSK